MKKMILLFVAVAIVTVVAIPSFAQQYETPEQRDQRQNQREQNLTKYEGSVSDLLDQVRKEKERVQRDRTELEARQQQVAPPAAGQFWPEPVPAPIVAAPAPQSAPQLVYRTLYYSYLDGCVTVAGWYPAWWIWPSWWYAGFPPDYCPVYGRVHGGWNHNNRSVVINNVTVNSTAINQQSFRSDVRKAFNSPHAAPAFDQRVTSGQAFGQAHNTASNQFVPRPNNQSRQNGGQSWSGVQQGGAPDWRQSQPRGGGGNWNSQGNTPNWSSRGGGGGGHRY